MREVVPGRLWIGNARDARDIRDVLRRGITAIIDLAIDEPPIVFRGTCCTAARRCWTEKETLRRDSQPC